MLKSFVNLAAAAVLAAAVPAWAQVQEIDPNQAVGYEDAGPTADDPQAAPDQPAPGFEWNPDQVPQAEAEPAEIPPPEAAPPPVETATAPAAADTTVPREDVFTAAEDVFGRGAQGLAG